MVRYRKSDLHHFSEADEFLLLFSHSIKAGQDHLLPHLRRHLRRKEETTGSLRHITYHIFPYCFCQVNRKSMIITLDREKASEYLFTLRKKVNRGKYGHHSIPLAANRDLDENSCTSCLAIASPRGIRDGHSSNRNHARHHIPRGL
jgi:hypothetical protein